MQDWRPSSDFEAQLAEAHDAGDLATCLGLLNAAELAMPLSPAAAAGDEAPAWPTTHGDVGTVLLAYTSAEAMEFATGGQVTTCRVVTLAEVAAGWPDPRWSLCVNLGVPVNFLFASGAVARLVSPTMAEERAVVDDEIPIVQKVLPALRVADYLGGTTTRVSGYVHKLAETMHIATPTVLLDALGASGEPGLVSEAGSVFLLRWPAFGPDLYRVPLGGVDEETRDAVEGWVIEEPPFVGLGFGRNVDQLVHEYRVNGVELPHGSELWELLYTGQYRRRAWLDTDRGRWLLIGRAGEFDPPRPEPGDGPKMAIRPPPGGAS